ncbi:MAG: hypothetical protein H6582_01800 [Crocinitomicaceae bacterium]|nr:hypothetical protein [Crocinitomicaceae bacterium]
MKKTILILAAICSLSATSYSGVLKEKEKPCYNPKKESTYQVTSMWDMFASNSGMDAYSMNVVNGSFVGNSIKIESLPIISIDTEAKEITVEYKKFTNDKGEEHHVIIQLLYSSSTFEIGNKISFKGTISTAGDFNGDYITVMECAEISAAE